MDKEKIICEIKEIISKRYGIMTITKKQNKKFENIRSYIIQQTQYLDRYYNDTSINKKGYQLTMKIRVAYFVADMDDIKRCNRCNKPVIKREITNINDINKDMNMRYCCAKCAARSEEVQNKKEESCLKHIGVRHPSQNNEVLEKMQKSCVKKFGVENVSQCQEIKDKKVSSFKSHYGTKSYFESDEFQNKNMKRWGVKYISQAKCIMDKINNTKRKNNSFNSSKIEDNLYLKLIGVFGKEDIKRHYVDKTRYPFECDFYIISKDLFIEYNGHWTHGRHSFNTNCKDDIELINQWSKKSISSQFYKNAIEVWTIRDVKKRNTAKQNNLNYLEFFNMKQFNDWISTVNR